MVGKLYGVGVGPGDPELLTLKAVRIIKECDLIAIPVADKNTCVAYAIVKQAIPEIVDKEVISIVMPMVKDKEILHESHKNGAIAVIEELNKGKNIAFLTLGDPTVYSTYIYIHKIVGQYGYNTEIISGIPSFCAVAARLNDSLVEKSEVLHVIPSSYPVEDILQLSGTKVLMKAGSKMSSVKKQLKASGLNAVMIENCGLENEKIYYTVDDIPDQAGYYSLIIVKDK